MNQHDLEHTFITSFDEYGDAIFRFCLMKVSNKELAEDMTQEVFTRYWQYVRNGKEMTNTRSFLYTIANNMAKDRYKKKKSESLDTYMESTGHEPASQESTQQYAMYHELILAIEDMEEKDKEVLLLRYVEGLDPKDIAEILKETANVVSVRINRAEKRLRKEMHI